MQTAHVSPWTIVISALTMGPMERSLIQLALRFLTLVCHLRAHAPPCYQQPSARTQAVQPVFLSPSFYATGNTCCQCGVCVPLSRVCAAHWVTDEKDFRSHTRLIWPCHQGSSRRIDTFHSFTIVAIEPARNYARPAGPKPFPSQVPNPNCKLLVFSRVLRLPHTRNFVKPASESICLDTLVSRAMPMLKYVFQNVELSFKITKILDSCYTTPTWTNFVVDESSPLSRYFRQNRRP